MEARAGHQNGSNRFRPDIEGWGPASELPWVCGRCLRSKYSSFLPIWPIRRKIIFGGDWHFQPRCCTPGSRWQPSTLLTHLTSSLIRFQQFLSRNTKKYKKYKMLISFNPAHSPQAFGVLQCRLLHWNGNFVPPAQWTLVNCPTRWSLLLLSRQLLLSTSI